MADIILTKTDLQRLDRGETITKSYASDQYGIDSSITIKLKD